jgi:hypothetical protein
VTPPAAIVPAMSAVIQGAEWINCEEDRKLGLHKVAKHYYSPGMHEPITGGQLIFNKDIWKKLPADLQEMSKAAAVYATTLRNQAQKYETALACKELLKAGVIMHRTPDDILINFLNEWEKISAEYAAKNPLQEGDRQPEEYAGRSCHTGVVPVLQLRRRVLLEGQDLLETVGDCFASRKRRNGAPATRPVMFIIAFLQGAQNSIMAGGSLESRVRQCHRAGHRPRRGAATHAKAPRSGRPTSAGARGPDGKPGIHTHARCDRRSSRRGPPPTWARSTLFNCAASCTTARSSTHAEDWDFSFNPNVKSMYLVARAFLPGC